MWFDAVSVEPDATGPFDDERLVHLLAPTLAEAPTRPRMLIDCRDSADRTQSTATYQLLTALHLVDAAPVALTCLADATGAYRTLEAVVAACPSDLPALIVATGDPTYPPCLAAALVGDQPLGPSSFEWEAPLAAEADERRGFMALLTALAADAGRVVRPKLR